MKIAIIAPTPHLNTFSRSGTCQMCLAHLLDDSVYHRFYRSGIPANFTIMDNGLYENGESMAMDDLIERIEDIMPHEAIAPDVLYSGEDTVYNTANFIESIKSQGLFGRIQIMGVVQGSTPDQWLDCLAQLSSMEGLDTIGLSKLAVPRCFGLSDDVAPVTQSRFRVMNLMSENHLWNPLKNYHLLGGDNWLPCELAMVKAKGYPIRSNDSSAAVFYGANGQMFNDHGKIMPFIKGNLPFDTHIDIAKYDAINHNIKTLLEAGK
jgi:hypothetical protein